MCFVYIRVHAPAHAHAHVASHGRWASLTDNEQALPRNCNELVSRCEELFASERQAWVSTSMASQMMGGGETEHKEGEKEGGEKQASIVPKRTTESSR